MCTTEGPSTTDLPWLLTLSHVHHRGPKYHWSSMTPDSVPCAPQRAQVPLIFHDSWLRPMCPTEGPSTTDLPWLLTPSHVHHRGPKYHWSSMTPDSVPCAPQRAQAPLIFHDSWLTSHVHHRGPKYHWSSMTPDHVPCAPQRAQVPLIFHDSWPRPMCTTEGPSTTDLPWLLIHVPCAPQRAQVPLIFHDSWFTSHVHHRGPKYHWSSMTPDSRPMCTTEGPSTTDLPWLLTHVPCAPQRAQALLIFHDSWLTSHVHHRGPKYHWSSMTPDHVPCAPQRAQAPLIFHDSWLRPMCTTEGPSTTDLPWLLTTSHVHHRGPKHHWSSMTPDSVPCAPQRAQAPLIFHDSWPCPMCTTEGANTTDLPWVPPPSHVHHNIDQNPMEFFFPTGRKGREQSRKAKVLRIPHHILSRILKQIPCL